MHTIEINNITKDYGKGKGIFNVSFSLEKGQVLGFLGPNGAGKTTTIRQLMGFSKPDKGDCSILGMKCWEDAHKIKEKVGYLPGEIAFMDDMTGMEFLQFMAKLKKMKNFSRAEELIRRLELNPAGKIKKMSKGMKQKIGIICAFMSEPEVLILDEPTSGLDPLMQSTFVELILEEKRKGTSILMSSHIFEEIEKTCDKAAVIKAGRIIAFDEISTLVDAKEKIFIITFEEESKAQEFSKQYQMVRKIEGNTVTAAMRGDINPFIKLLAHYQIKSLDSKSQSLEELFMHFYGGEEHDQ